MDATTKRALPSSQLVACIPHTFNALTACCSCCRAFSNLPSSIAACKLYLLASTMHTHFQLSASCSCWRALLTLSLRAAPPASCNPGVVCTTAALPAPEPLVLAPCPSLELLWGQ